MTPFLALLLATLLDPSAPPLAQASDVRLVGETAAGEVRELPLASLPLTSLAAADLVVLDVLGADAMAPAAPQELGVLELAGGDRLQGRVAGGDGEVLTLELLGQVVLPVDIASFRSLVFPGRIPDDLSAAVSAPPELDRLYRRVGGALDPIDGTVEGFSAGGIVFESLRVGRREVPWREVAALFVEVLEEGAPREAEEGARVVVDLADGSRLRGRMQRLSTAGLQLTVGRATEVALPLETLGEIARDDGSIAFLSDLAAASEVGRGNPFDGDAAGDDVFGMVWPYRSDRCATGAPLRAGGRVWRRGLGAHAPSGIRFKLDSGWRELRGAVAIDDSVLHEPARGSVIFRIHLDGELAWESPQLASGDAPLSFPPLALEGKKELLLEADMATELSQGDRADWLRMMLLR
ncbi:MAG: NPCBM/NEW2 domain-containing protein [Planctomycetota bacterium]